MSNKTVPMHGFGGSSALLNFSVVGGTSEPAYPRENMIWVNTSTKITSWIFSDTQPAKPEEGVVWIKTGLSSPASFNALKQNGIRINPLLCKQYISGTWVVKTAQTYMNGKWKSWIAYLYINGDECLDVTGGWVSTACIQGYNDWGAVGSAYAPKITRNSMNMTVESNGDGCGLVHTANMIDLSEVNTIVMHGTILSSWGKISTGIFIRDNLRGGYSADYSAKYTPANEGVEETGPFAIDVSALSGNYYICLGVAEYVDTATSKIVMKSMAQEV